MVKPPLRKSTKSNGRKPPRKKNTGGAMPGAIYLTGLEVGKLMAATREEAATRPATAVCFFDFPARAARVRGLPHEAQTGGHQGQGLAHRKIETRVARANCWSPA